MRFEEANYLAQRMLRISAEDLSPCLNLGSSTREFRERIKPHIQEHFLRPLELHGVSFVHVDLKPGDGVDIAGNLYTEEIQQRIRAVGARSLVLTNVLEHVRDPSGLAQLCSSLLAPGGYLVVSVPRSYPYHADPIDTMFRPTPQEIATLFQGARLIDSTVLDAGGLLDDLRSRGGLATQLPRLLARLLLPFYKPRAWLNHAHRLLWITRPFKVSIVLLRKSSPVSHCEVG